MKKSSLIVTLIAAASLSVTVWAKSCCDKAKEAGKACDHACCVDATKAGKVCDKCNAAPKTCCEKAKAKGEACAHPCCVDATKAGKVCEKCNPPAEPKKAE
jgi:hypothetical protein